MVIRTIHKTVKQRHDQHILSNKCILQIAYSCMSPS
uniref:Uncharacterized protein n=1 Tax=Anguilla anguilla TaxID=7936 RepID=A0A0E9R1R6_ANGAN